MKPQVPVLVGMVAAGKSTYAHNAAKAGYLVVNDDSLVEAVDATEGFDAVVAAEWDMVSKGAYYNFYTGGWNG